MEVFMNTVLLNSVYKHEKRGGIYQTLMLSNSDKEEHIVYINDKGEVWSKPLTRFLNGMTLIDKQIIRPFDHKEIGNEYPVYGDFYYNNETDQTKKSAPAASVLYITNVFADQKEDYPVSVYFLSNGIIDYLPLYEFYQHFSK